MSKTLHFWEPKANFYKPTASKLISYSIHCRFSKQGKNTLTLYIGDGIYGQLFVPLLSGHTKGLLPVVDLYTRTHVDIMCRGDGCMWPKRTWCISEQWFCYQPYLYNSSIHCDHTCHTHTHTHTSRITTTFHHEGTTLLSPTLKVWYHDSDGVVLGHQCTLTIWYTI